MDLSYRETDVSAEQFSYALLESQLWFINFVPFIIAIFGYVRFAEKSETAYGVTSYGCSFINLT